MPFQKGVSGNPKGRNPRRVEDAKKTAFDRLLTAAREEAMINAMINKVINEGDVSAFRALMERRYGKVPVAVPEQTDSETTIRVEYGP